MLKSFCFCFPCGKSVSIDMQFNKTNYLPIGSNLFVHHTSFSLLPCQSSQPESKLVGTLWLDIFVPLSWQAQMAWFLVCLLSSTEKIKDKYLGKLHCCIAGTAQGSGRNNLLNFMKTCHIIIKSLSTSIKCVDWKKLIMHPSIVTLIAIPDAQILVKFTTSLLQFKNGTPPFNIYNGYMLGQSRTWPLRS